MRRLMAIFLLTLACGCASLAPERQRPAMPVPELWPDGQAANNATTIQGWRDIFPDPTLQKLIATAIEQNRDLRQAVLAMDLARAQAGIASANRLPEIDASGDKTTQRLPADLNGGVAGINRKWTVGLGITAFELDFFGRVKNLETAALESYLATEEARRAAQISLVSQIAQTYLTLAADREALTLATDTLASRKATLKLTEARITNGLGTDLDRYTAEEAVAVAESEQARLTAQVAMDQNALAVLVGTPITAADLPAKTINDVVMVENIDPGLPSDLLTRRPDILEAEHKLWAAGAEIGAARAAFFPRITLTGTAGFASLELTDLFKGASRTWSFIPSISVPIFDAGRNKANLAVAEAQQKISIAQYEQAIQTAFREVSDALAKQQGYAGQLQAQNKRVVSTERSRVLVEQRNQAGLESALAVHDAERSLFSARQNLLSVRLAQKLTFVQLFAALGGGWNETSSAANN